MALLGLPLSYEFLPTRPGSRLSQQQKMRSTDGGGCGSRFQARKTEDGAAHRSCPRISTITLPLASWTGFDTSSPG